METALELDLPVDHTSVREARQAVGRIDALVAASVRDAQLIVSELVSNALTHAALGPHDLIAVPWRATVTGCASMSTTAGRSPPTRKPSCTQAAMAATVATGWAVQTLAIRWQAVNGRVSVWLDVSSCV